MIRSFIVCAALLGLVGCSTGEVKLGVDVAPIKVASVDGIPTDLPTNAEFELTRVRLLVGHAKVGYAGGCGSDGAEIGPQVVDLTADEIARGAHREFSLGELPTGTYGGAEIEIQPIEADQDASGEEFADFQKSGASVLIDGNYQGASFSFAGHFLAEQGTDGEVKVDEETPVSLALTVDASSWFRDGNHAVIDPLDETQHEALAVAICKTLDTQPQLTQDAPTARSGKRHRGPDHRDERPHCVENAP